MQISTEYRRGILFIRLRGRIDEYGFIKKINDLIDEFGIKYIVLNFENLKYISLDSIEHIIKYYKKILKKKKSLLICDANKGRIKVFNNIIPNIDNELEAFSLI